jgi:hypothetical protein
MTDSMAANRIVHPASQTLGPLAVQDRRRKEKDRPAPPPAKPRSAAPAPEDPGTGVPAPPSGKAIDIRI